MPGDSIILFELYNMQSGWYFSYTSLTAHGNKVLNDIGQDYGIGLKKIGYEYWSIESYLNLKTQWFMIPVSYYQTHVYIYVAMGS